MKITYFLHVAVLFSAFQVAAEPASLQETIDAKKTENSAKSSPEKRADYAAGIEAVAKSKIVQVRGHATFLDRVSFGRKRRSNVSQEMSHDPHSLFLPYAATVHCFPPVAAVEIDSRENLTAARSKIGSSGHN